MKTEGFTRVLWLACWLRKLEIWVHSLLTEDTSKTEDRLYSFCRRGFLFSREEESDFVSGRCGRRIEDTPKTESRCYWFCRWGYLFNREEKSDSGCLGDVEERFVHGLRFLKVSRMMV